MPCLPAARRTQLLARYNQITQQLVALNAAYDAAVQNSEVKEYRFDSGEGSQRTERRSPQELWDLIEEMEAAQDRIYRKLYGQALVNMNLRRKRYTYGRRSNYGRY